MKFRALLVAVWTVLLLWQLTRVFGDEAAWGGYTLTRIPILAIAFPFVEILRSI